jgi:hypothetical protein
MRSLAIALFALVAACDKTVPTPNGNLLDRPAFTKTSVTDWTVGAPAGPATKVTKSFRWTSKDLGPDVKFSIAFEHGPSTLVETKPKASAPPNVDAPRAVRIDLVENTRWAITAKCDDDLKVPLAVNPDGTSAYPKSVWAQCELVMKRKNGDITVAPWIEIHGDGKLVVTAVGTDEHVVEE